jgi:hypothetical protein
MSPQEKSPVWPGLLTGLWFSCATSLAATTVPDHGGRLDIHIHHPVIVYSCLDGNITTPKVLRESAGDEFANHGNAGIAAMYATAQQARLDRGQATQPGPAPTSSKAQSWCNNT